MDLFLFIHDLTRLSQRIESSYYFFIDTIYCCFFFFISNRQNRYMIHRNLDLFYEICNTITEHNGRQTHYLSLIPNYYDIYFQVSQKVFFMCFIINHDFYVIPF